MNQESKRLYGLYINGKPYWISQIKVSNDPNSRDMRILVSKEGSPNCAMHHLPYSWLFSSPSKNKCITSGNVYERIFKGDEIKPYKTDFESALEEIRGQKGRNKL